MQTLWLNNYPKLVRTAGYKEIQFMLTINASKTQTWMNHLCSLSLSLSLSSISLSLSLSSCFDISFWHAINTNVSMTLIKIAPPQIFQAFLRLKFTFYRHKLTRRRSQETIKAILRDWEGSYRELESKNWELSLLII